MAKRHYSTTTTRSQTENISAAQHKSEAATSPKASTKWTVFSHPALCYGVGFLLLWTFVVVTYGDVFQHIAAENYFSFDRDTMAYVLRRDLGVALWGGRFLLLAFNNIWVGGTLLAALFTLTAWLFDTGRRRTSWQGIGFLPVMALLGWMVMRGFNLFLRNDPSIFVLLSVGLLLLSALYALIVKWVQGRQSSVGRKGFPWSLLVVMMAYGGLTYAARVLQENVVISCRMQNELAQEDWEAMVETARTADRPSRTIAALHALALVQQNQLLEGMFEINYDFPELTLDYVAGKDESVNYVPDCNLHAGLVNAAYRSSMENTVVLGPRVSNFKRMALCTVLNHEVALGERYFHLIGKMPFESDFVKRYRPMLSDTTLIAHDPTLARIRSLTPMERRFEQNYRQPAFLGYNVGLMQGADPTLITSVATCLYSKDLDNFLMRVGVMRQKMPLPPVVLQAIAVASIKREGVLQQFPEVDQLTMSQLRAFVSEVSPYIEAQMQMNDEEKAKSKREMAEALRENWLGTYMYYYYCGNVGKPQQEEKGHGVN